MQLRLETECFRQTRPNTNSVLLYLLVTLIQLLLPLCSPRTIASIRQRTSRKGLVLPGACNEHTMATALVISLSRALQNSVLEPSEILMEEWLRTKNVQHDVTAALLVGVCLFSFPCLFLPLPSLHATRAQTRINTDLVVQSPRVPRIREFPKFSGRASAYLATRNEDTRDSLGLPARQQ